MSIDDATIAERRRITGLLDAGLTGEPLQQAIEAGTDPSTAAQAMLTSITRQTAVEIPAPPERQKRLDDRAEAERTRVMGILTAEVPIGMDREMLDAIRYGYSVGEFLHHVNFLVRDRGVTVEQLAAGGQSVPRCGARPKDGDSSTRRSWDRVVAKMKESDPDTVAAERAQRQRSDSAQ